jgi:hypothetical protein
MKSAPGLRLAEAPMWCWKKSGALKTRYRLRMITMSTVFFPKHANGKQIAGIRWSVCRICEKARRTTMRNELSREIKPSLREFEAPLAHEEKVNA